MTYTHVFINSTREMLPIKAAADAVQSTAARAFGFVLVDADRVKFDMHGKPCHRAGGWSYGHVQGGFICAGAGGLNSLRVAPLHA